MSRFKYYLLLILIQFEFFTAFSQDEKLFSFEKLKPIVQVFGTASYDFENERYSYGFGRAHLGFQYQFNEDWSAKIIIDRGRPTKIADITVEDYYGNILNIQDASNEGSYYTMFLKFASLKWQINKHWSIEGGSVLQNHYITQERFWGLRYVAQTFQDLYWKIPSADLGFITRFKANDVFGFDLAVTNGEGPRVNQDKEGKVKLAVGIDVNPSKKIQTRAYGHIRNSDMTDAGTEQMASVFCGVRPSEKFRIGGEFNYMKNLNYTKEIDSYGISLFSVYRIREKTEVFARYDRLMYKFPSQINFNGNDGNTFIGGVSYSPLKGINLSVNYQAWFTDDADNQNALQLSMEYKF